MPKHHVFLPSGQILIIENGSDGVRCRRVGSKNQADFTGVFAQAVDALAKGKVTQQQAQRLATIEKSTSWLKGLSAGTQLPASLGKALLGSRLGLLFIELTNRCNEKCLHCYAESGPERTSILACEDIQRALVEAKELGADAVQFTGGDPLLHPDLAKAVETAHTLAYENVEIYTNGLLLTRKLLDQITPFMPSLAFSVYSHDASCHDKITGVKGSHRKTLAAIARAIQPGFYVRIGIILMQENLGHERKTVSFLMDHLDLPRDRIGVDVAHQTGRGMFMDYQPDLPPTENTHADATEIPDRAGNSATKSNELRQGKLCVSADGDVFPCIFSRGSPLGSIHRNSLQEIITKLDHRLPAATRPGQWRQIQQAMTCEDCQIIAGLMGCYGENHVDTCETAQS